MNKRVRTPAERERRRLYLRECRRRDKATREAVIAAGVMPVGRRDGDPMPSLAEMRRLLAAIPVDTRNLTARVCGDPLPGRSALDKRASA